MRPGADAVRPTGSLQGWLDHEDCLHANTSRGARHQRLCFKPGAVLAIRQQIQHIIEHHRSARIISQGRVDGKSSVKGLSLLRAAIAERRFLPMLPDSLRTNHLTRYGG